MKVYRVHDSQLFYAGELLDSFAVGMVLVLFDRTKSIIDCITSGAYGMLDSVARIELPEDRILVRMGEHICIATYSHLTPSKATLHCSTEFSCNHPVVIDIITHPALFNLILGRRN